MQTSILLSAVEARGRGGGVAGTCRLNQECELKAVWHKSISPTGLSLKAKRYGRGAKDWRYLCFTVPGVQPKSFKKSNN
jgi:hypothetical protein